MSEGGGGKGSIQAAKTMMIRAQTIADDRQIPSLYDAAVQCAPGDDGNSNIVPYVFMTLAALISKVR